METSSFCEEDLEFYSVIIDANNDTHNYTDNVILKSWGEVGTAIYEHTGI